MREDRWQHLLHAAHLLEDLDIPTPSEELLGRYNVSGPRYTSYPTAPTWREDFGAEALSERLADAGARGGSEPLSLYVHLPFCRSLCWYCGCNVVISKDAGAADRYLDHLALELDLVAERLGSRRALSQVHWGGGTPTFLSEAQLERLWTELTRRFTPLPDAEVAIEVHPALTTPGQLSLLRQLGFNRVSMGLQDFDPRVQQTTNRISGRTWATRAPGTSRPSWSGCNPSRTTGWWSAPARGWS